MLEDAIVVVTKVCGFDKPVFGFVFEGGLFDVGGEVGGELAGKRGFVNFLVNLS